MIIGSIVFYLLHSTRVLQSQIDEEKHFAEVYAEQEHQKVAHELAFNQAAFQAMRRLYPDEKMIKPFDTTPFNPGGRHNTQ